MQTQYLSVPENKEKARKAVRRWMDNNVDRMKEVHRLYFEKNKERISEWHKEWYSKNSERILAQCKERHRLNPDYLRKWKQDNREQVRAYENNRRAKKRGNGGSYTGEEFIALCNKYDNRCLDCRKIKPLTADHVIPVSKGGTSNIDNIQPLCRSCNSKKQDKHIDYRINWEK